MAETKKETKKEKEPIDWMKKLVEISANQLIEQSKVPVMLESIDNNIRSMDKDIKAMHTDLLTLDKNMAIGFNTLGKNLISGFSDLMPYVMTLNLQ
ncbi:MAG: hypothetical protein ACE5KE_12415 [Methanosarcinales archaeon]